MLATETNGPRTVGGGPGRVLKIVTEMGSTAVGSVSPGLGLDAAKSFVEATQKEKKELQALNDRLCNYIERVRKLEEQNRRLCGDIDEARDIWGRDFCKFKDEHVVYLQDARRDINDLARQKAELELKAAHERDDLNEMHTRYKDRKNLQEADAERKREWERALSDAEREAELLRGRLRRLGDDDKKFRGDSERLRGELETAHKNLDEETIHRLDSESQVQTLLEELEFLKRVHEQEVKELQALLVQSPADTREFFKNELALAIRDIQNEYDYIAALGNKEMESWYKLKVSEAEGSANRPNVEQSFEREEVKRIRDIIGDVGGQLTDAQDKNAILERQLKEVNSQLDDTQREYEKLLNDRENTLRRMRDESNALIQELQALLGTKQLLDSEIAIYRTMLQKEESRTGLRQVVEQVMKTRSLQQQEDTDSTRNVRGEVSTKTTFQKSAKGNVIISDCDPDGAFVELQNTHPNKEEDISFYKVKRSLDNNRDVVYTIPADTVLRPKATLKIYARGHGTHKPPQSLVFREESTWGTSKNVLTKLINRENDEKAFHKQFTVLISQ